MLGGDVSSKWGIVMLMAIIPIASPPTLKIAQYVYDAY